MILLDTNVVSELMRPRPAAAVLGWFAAQPVRGLFLPAIAEAELRAGVALLPAGRRRDALCRAVDEMVAVDFAGRVVPFDSAAARAYAGIVAQRRAAGRPVTEADCQIAAIALAREWAVATRNVADFEGTGPAIVNPWDYEAH